MRIYVSGRIKDYPGYLEHFQRACHILAMGGQEPVNPCDVVLEPLETNYQNYMKADIRLLLDCEAIYMLEGWEQSTGARCEHLVAAMCGLQVLYESPGHLAS